MHIRSLGNWTNKLYDFFYKMSNENNNADKKKVLKKANNDVSIEVPYSKERRMSRMGRKIIFILKSIV